MAREIFRIQGLRETQLALSELPRAVGRGVLRRTLINAAQPMATEAAAAAPDDPDSTGFDLHTSIKVGTKLSRRQARLHKRGAGSGTRMVEPGVFRRPAAAFVEVFFGAGPLPQAHLQEFGNAHQSPQAFMRPAWEGGKYRALKSIVADLTAEIEKARKRLAARAARVARKR